MKRRREEEDEGNKNHWEEASVFPATGKELSPT